MKVFRKECLFFFFFFWILVVLTKKGFDEFPFNSLFGTGLCCRKGIITIFPVRPLR